MKKIFLLFTIMSCSFALSGQSGDGKTPATAYYGTIATTVTWTYAYNNGIIYVGRASPNQDLTISSGGRLTIDPGVTVKFCTTATDLKVIGTGILTAVGTVSSPITFTRDINATWGHISFESSSGISRISQCIIEYGLKSGSGIEGYGGGIHINSNTLTIDFCTFRENIALWGGAVFVNKTRTPVISNCYFFHNTASFGGGALNLWNTCAPVITNCIFENNVCSNTGIYGGGGIFIGPSAGAAKIINCTLINNTTTANGDNVFFMTSPSSRMVNSLVWGSDNAIFLYDNTNSPDNLINCAVQRVYKSTGEVPISYFNNTFKLNSSDSDPAGPNFVGSGPDPWSVKFISPCRDSGIDSYSSPNKVPATDYNGKPRILTTDIGVYEVQYSRWTGVTNTTWATSTNWVTSVDPATGSGDVYIPSGLTNYPTGSASQNFTIGSGKYMTLEPGAKTTLGTLTNNGTLRLQSSATGISTLILTTFTGNDASVELYLTGGGTKDTYKWHYISTPVTTLPVSTFAPGITQDVAQWIESRPILSTREGWVAYDGFIYSTQAMGGPTFSNLTPGKGYDYWNDSDNKFTFPGQLNTSDAVMALEFSGSETLHGFNLLGNPFSAGLNWDDIKNSVYFTFPSGTSKCLYFTRDNVQCTYSSGVGIPIDVTGIIPPMQGFFTKTYSTGNTITLPAAARVHDNIHPTYKGSTPIPLVRLSLAEGKLTDETVVRFDIAAKTDLDFDYDALKMFLSSNIVSIYSSVAGAKYAINGLPFPETFVEIPVVVNLTKDTIHTISATQLQGLDNYAVSLTDNTTGFTADLKKTPVLTFSAAAGTVTGRFVLKISAITTGTENPVASENIFNIYPSDRLINIQTVADEWDGKSGSVRVLDMTGKTVATLERVEFSRNSILQLPVIGARGLYFVEIRSWIMKYAGKVVVK